MKLAWFASPARGEAEAYATAFLAELVTRAEIGVFVEGGKAAPAVAVACVHDLDAVHYRNVLHPYDAIVYVASSASPAGKAAEAFCEWPGIAVVPDVSACDFIMRDAALRRALVRRMSAVVVHSRALADRIAAEDPESPVFVIERPGQNFAALGARILEICHDALARGRYWLEPLLESACAEIPGFSPGDRRAPWRATVDELSRLVDRPRSR